MKSQSRLLLASFLIAGMSVSAADSAPGFRMQLDTISRGYDGRTCWVHPRAGAIPGPTPAVVLTMQKLLLTGSDVFFALNEMRTDDLGKTWRGPTEHADTLGRRNEPDGVIVATCDFTPKWHAKTGKLLGTGHTERVLVPERSARLGNFAVTDVSEIETWVTVAEWMQTWGPKIVIPPDNKYGADNSVYAARILWDKPNGDWNRH